MRLPLLILPILGTISGCGGGECGQEQCKSFIDVAVTDAKASVEVGVLMTDFEKSLVEPMLAEVRRGIEPWDDNGIGICKGAKTCEEFIGLEGMNLTEGRYIVRTELKVPDVGPPGTWKVTFATKCTTERLIGDKIRESESEYDRTYTVRYAGPQRGYRLQPLRTIESPSPSGARLCTYTITTHHPDGDKSYSGKWSVPGPNGEIFGQGGKGKGKGKGAKGKGAKGKGAKGAKGKGAKGGKTGAKGGKGKKGKGKKQP